MRPVPAGPETRRSQSVQVRGLLIATGNPLLRLPDGDLLQQTAWVVLTPS
jgi:hypothetical protein